MSHELVLTIVVRGENIMGDALCQMHGVLTNGKSAKRIEYSGPVHSAKDVADAIADLFKEST